NGDFFDGGSYYAAGPSIGVLTPGGKPSLVAPSWETYQVFAFDNQGNFLPGWPQPTIDELWSGVAIGDLDGDGSKELVTASLGPPISGSVAVGHLDGPGDPRLDIVVPVLNDSLYVFEANGARHVGFPRFMRLSGSSKTPSPALADMNGDGYTDIIQATTNGLV